MNKEQLHRYISEQHRKRKQTYARFMPLKTAKLSMMTAGMDLRPRMQ